MSLPPNIRNHCGHRLRVNNVWRHLKTGNLYVITGFAANTTNAQDGQQLVLYARIDDVRETIYAREIGEFVEKFKSNAT